jgi:hypothetical protein
MNIVKHRYSAEIQRTRGLLEVAAALYDTSLSFQTERAAEQAIQTESRVGYSLTLALTATREKGISFSFAADGFRELQAVSRGRLSLAWINPSVAATMAFKGKGLFSKRQPIRTIAVFLRTTLWDLPCTSPLESPRSIRSERSASRFESRPEPSPKGG